VAHAEPTNPQALGAVPEAVDPDLVALPAPPRGRRILVMAVMALVVACSFGLLMSLRLDVGYFFSNRTPIVLGEVTELAPAEVEPNRYVQVSGTPMASATVRFSRLAPGTTYLVFPLAGQQQRSIFVQVPLESPDAMRDFARRDFAGRVVTFGQLGGRFRPVRNYMKDVMGLSVSSESLLVLADEAPGSYGWALALSALCLVFIGVNLFMLLRWFRPLR
jgi:hypothetical protein